jgi:lipopolysaccharide/colanic/teichoic acid biosynthesis glycosyltransferase
LGAGQWGVRQEGAPTTDRNLTRIASAGAKRAIDIIVAAIVLLVTIPITLVVVAAILVESPGPIFYRAERVGRSGRRLRMLKFRKMAPDARGVRLTVDADERLTRVGAVLARTRLDELPQFWHVLRGEMSLIGPRPEDPGFVARRPDDFRRILEVRPGISGLSQLAFAEEARILSRDAGDDPVAHYIQRILPQKCMLDRLYVERATVLTDLRIVFWTLVAVVLRKPVAVHRGTGATSVRRRPADAPAPEVAPAQAPVAESLAMVDTAVGMEDVAHAAVESR